MTTGLFALQHNKPVRQTNTDIWINIHLNIANHIVINLKKFSFSLAKLCQLSVQDSIIVHVGINYANNCYAPAMPGYIASVALVVAISYFISSLTLPVSICINSLLVHQCSLKPWKWRLFWKIPKKKHIHAIYETFFGVHGVFMLLVMLYWKLHVFCVIAYTPKCRNRHQNQISILNVGKIMKF